MTFHGHGCRFLFPFFPKQKPRNLKFRITNTLTVRLFSRFTFSFSVSSRHFVLLSSRRSATRSLFASSTMSFVLTTGKSLLITVKSYNFPTVRFTSQTHMRHGRGAPMKISTVYFVSFSPNAPLLLISLRMMWMLLQTCLIAVRVNSLAGKLLKKFFFITRCS